MSVTTSQLLIPARDGYPLGATLYQPKVKRSINAAPQAVALINCATAVKQRLYSWFAIFLAADEIAVLTYVFRGIGRPRPDSLKGFDARLSEWGTHDLPAAIDWLAARYPDARLFVVGHSIGGQLLGLAENNA